MKAHVKSLASVLMLGAVGIGGGLLAARGYLHLSPAYISGDYSAHRAQARERVILLGSTWCGYCAKTRAYLTANAIAFADIDIEQSAFAEQWLTDLGAEGVPVILVGDRQIRGFRPEAIAEAVAALPTSP
jgi:mycoredoxin